MTMLTDTPDAVSCSTVESARISRAQRFERAGRWGAACAQYEKLLKDPLTSRETRVNATRWLGRAHLENGNRSAAMDVLQVAVQEAWNSGKGSAVAQALNVLAIVEQRGGNLERAAELYREARGHADFARDRALIAMIDQNLGTVSNILGYVNAALDSFRLSLAGYRELGLSRYCGQVLNNMGLAFADLGDFQSAELAYEDAIREFEIDGEQTMSHETAVNQIQLWIAMGRFDQALAKSRELLASGGAHESPWLGEVYRHIGVVAREQCNYPWANESFQRAEAIAREFDDLLLAADLAEQKAELFWLEERHSDMLTSLNDARAIYMRMNAVNRVARVERRNVRLEYRFLEIARKWGDSIEGADRYTQGHCERVATIACALAERAGLDQRDMFWFRLGALLHDVGKIIVPTDVLNKPGSLTPEEWELMKRHPEAGLELVAGIDFPGEVRAMIRNHHERWDGKGYPDGLVGDATPLPARLLCLADVYDALTSARPYRKPLSHAQGVEIMLTSEGQFDPELLAHFASWAGESEQRQCA